MALEVEMQGQVGRQIPDADPEHLHSIVRIGRYDELYVLPITQTMHMLPDEGTYFISNINSTGVAGGIGTGLVSGTMPTSWTDTGTGYLAIKNNDSAANTPNGKRIYLDYIKLIATANTGSTTAAGFLNFALRVDNINKASAGTALSTYNINMDGTNSSRAIITAGAVTLAASSSSVITLGRGLMRISTSATTMPIVVGDVFIIKSGSVESNRNGDQLALATAVSQTIPVPPIVYGPQQILTLQMWYTGVTTPGTITFEGEVGWWER